MGGVRSLLSASLGTELWDVTAEGAIVIKEPNLCLLDEETEAQG